MAEAGMMRVGLAQTRPVPGDREANLAALSEVAGTCRADLLVFPELASSGYGLPAREDFLRLAEQNPDAGALKTLADLSNSLDAAIVAGFPLLEEGRLYNASGLFRPGESPVFYRKIHLFDREKDIFDAGQEAPAVWSFRGARIGMMICFDWIFPETARMLSLSGADIIAHPANLVLDYCQRAVFARAVENGVFIATANRVGADLLPDGRELRFTGRSQLLDPRGRALMAFGPGECRVEVAEVDYKLARDKDISPSNHLFQDRRPALYRSLIAKGDCDD